MRVVLGVMAIAMLFATPGIQVAEARVSEKKCFVCSEDGGGGVESLGGAAASFGGGGPNEVCAELTGNGYGYLACTTTYVGELTSCTTWGEQTCRLNGGGPDLASALSADGTLVPADESSVSVREDAFGTTRRICDYAIVARRITDATVKTIMGATSSITI